ncbi:hypothetical protein [Streptosporangium sp. G12]
MSEYDPASGLTYGEWLRRKTLQVLPKGRTWATRDQRSTKRRPDGVLYQETVDQLGHMTREHGDGRRDVEIRLRG